MREVHQSRRWGWAIAIEGDCFFRYYKIIRALLGYRKAPSPTPCEIVNLNCLAMDNLTLMTDQSICTSGSSWYSSALTHIYALPQALNLRGRYFSESSESGKDGSSYPSCVFPFWRSKDLDFSPLYCKSFQLILYTLSKSYPSAPHTKKGMDLWRESFLPITRLYQIDFAVNLGLSDLLNQTTSHAHPDTLCQ